MLWTFLLTPPTYRKVKKLTTSPTSLLLWDFNDLNLSDVPKSKKLKNVPHLPTLNTVSIDNGIDRRLAQRKVLTAGLISFREGTVFY